MGGGSTSYAYLNLTKAKDACNKHDDCGSITRFTKWNNGEGDQFYGICKGTALMTSTEGMDSWVKRDYGEFCVMFHRSENLIIILCEYFNT